MRTEKILSCCLLMNMILQALLCKVINRFDIDTLLNLNNVFIYLYNDVYNDSLNNN